MRKHSAVITEIICFLLIVLFVYTAASKLIDVERFRLALFKSPLLSRVSLLVSWAVPLIEIVISAGLLIPRARRAALFASFILMSLFTGYIGYMLLTQSKLPCSCGGVIRSLSWKQHFFFNLLFTGLAFAGWILARRSFNKPAQAVPTRYSNKPTAGSRQAKPKT